MSEVDLQLEDTEDHHKFTQRGLRCMDCGLSVLLMDWYCFKDKVKMEDADIKLAYLVNPKYQRTSVQKGKRCPVCGLSFFMETFAVGRLATAERLLEKK